MKTTAKIRHFIIIFTVLILFFIPFIIKNKVNRHNVQGNLSAEQYANMFLNNITTNHNYLSSLDGLDGYEGVVYNIEELYHQTNDEYLESRNVSTTNINTCNSITSSHGPGREDGYCLNFLSTGCSNYKGYSYTYSTTDIPYYIDEQSMTGNHAEIIREQAALWNQTFMHDGTGKLVNFYEVTDTNPINNLPVVIVRETDLSSKHFGGLFNASKTNPVLEIAHTFNPGTPLHEFGHVLGLDDLDGSVNNASHKVLMGYGRNIFISSDNEAIHYQDIQGVAVINRKHTNHQFTKYIYDNGKYVHLCFYCDIADIRDSAILGSSEIELATNCEHVFEPIVSVGDRHWVKCCKCYKVLESDFYLKSVNYMNQSGLEIIKPINAVEESLTLPNRIGGFNVIGIGSNAFANNTLLKNVELPSTIEFIGNHAFSGCTGLSCILVPPKLTNIGYGAFSGCYNLTFYPYHTNPYFTVIGGVIYNKDQSELLQACEIPDSFTVPDSVLKITPYAFEYNRRINNIRFTGNPEIGDYAFANCVHLEMVYFDTYSAPVVGTDVFQNKVPTIVVPYNAQDDFKQAFSQYPNAITSSQLAVSFISNGQVIESRTVYNGSTIESLPVPILTGYDFGGWYDNQSYYGNPYTVGDLWESDSTITLYAKWTPQDCIVIFDGNGGIISGDNYVTVKYGSSFSVSLMVNKEGNVLDGWYDSEDVQYVTADGRSTKEWDKVGITTLKAKWSPKNYEIKINNNGSITWLSNNGLSDNKCYIKYGTVLSAINLIATFKRSAQGFKEGKIFDHFEYENSTVDWTSVPDLGENYSVINIIPIWIKEKHTIYFNPLCDMDVAPIVAAYDSSISLPKPSRTGYRFYGWYTARTDGTKITWKTMPDLTPTDQNNGSTQLYAHWAAIPYFIYYNSNGGSGTMAYTTHTYDISSALRKNTFTKVGHDFIGWATTASGSVVYTDGQSVINLAKTPSVSITLYAKWQAKKYNVFYKNLLTNLIVENAYCHYEYGKGIDKLPKPRFVGTNGVGSEIGNFYGWYSTKEFTTQVTCITATQLGDITLYAKYDYLLLGVFVDDTYTITDAGKEKNNDILFYTSMSTSYPRMKDTTLSKIRIEFSLDLWEVYDGYQHIYLRDDTKNKIIWSKQLDYGGNKTNTAKKNYTFTIVLDLEQYKDTESFTFLFDASGFGPDTWKFTNFAMYMSCTN